MGTLFTEKKSKFNWKKNIRIARRGAPPAGRTAVADSLKKVKFRQTRKDFNT